MDADRFQRLMAIFQEALGAEGEARRQIIEGRCAGDAELKREVTELLGEHHREAGPVATAVGLEQFGRGSRRVAIDPCRTETEAMPGLPVLSGSYRLIRVLGEGGMGIVYEAEQHFPRRTVAIKALLHPGLASGNMIRRFHQEAQILAQLRHPGIAQIHEAGAADAERPGEAFIVMEFIDGPPITAHAQQAGLGARERARLVARVCEAVHHAHQRGVIHRDLKPSNILVGSDGQPKVLDFGVARMIGPAGGGGGAARPAQPTFTGAGQIIGTLGYMSPEQIAGGTSLGPEHPEVGARSDVYALGVILHELLAGELPLNVSGKSLPEAMDIIRQQEPKKLGSTRPELRGDIETIVAKALEKDAARRYQSAEELGADLERFVRDEPIAARRDSASYLLGKRLRRYRRALMAGSLAALIVAGLAIYAALLAGRNGDLASRREMELRASNVERGQLLGLTGNMRVAEGMIWKELFEAKEPIRTRARWALWELYEHMPCLRSLPPRSAGVTCTAYSPDGRWIALANPDRGAIEVWDGDLAERRWQQRSSPPDVMCSRVVWSPDGSMLASCGDEGAVHLWRAADGAKIREWSVRPPGATGNPDYADSVFTVAFSPDGKQLAVNTRGGRASIWNVDDGTMLRSLDAGFQHGYDCVFSPDGALLAVSGSSNHIQLFDANTGAPVRRIPTPAGSITQGLAFSPDSTTLASVGSERGLRLTSLATGESKFTPWSITGSSIAVAFGPRGDEVYTASYGVEVWSGRTGEHLSTAVPGERAVMFVSVRPDGQRIVTGATDRRVRLWETGRRSWEHPMTEFAGPPCPAAFSRGDSGVQDSVLIARRGDIIQRIRLSDHYVEATSAAMPSFPGTLAAADGANIVVCASSDGAAALLDTRTLSTLQTYPANSDPAAFISAAVQNLGDGRSIAVIAGPYQRLRIWEADAQSPANIKLATDTVAKGLAIRALAVSPRDTSALGVPGRWIVCADIGDTLHVWDNRLNRWVYDGSAGATGTGLTFTRDGHLLLGADGSGGLVLIEPGTWRRVGLLQGHARYIEGIAASSDGSLIASCSNDGEVKLWDGRWLREGYGSLTTLSFPGARTLAVRFSVDGHGLLVTPERGPVVFCDLTRYDPHIEGNRAYQMSEYQASVGGAGGTR